MEWKINKGSNGCVMCGKEFSEEEEYFSALFDEANAFLRKDFCASCWDKDKESGPFSFWKTKVPKKDKPPQKFANVEVFLDIFAKLEGNNDPRQKNLRYVLSLYLIRKKIFKLDSWQKKDGAEIITVYYPKGDRKYDVFNPDLKDDEIDAITSEMNQLLNDPYLEHEALSA